MSKRTLAATLSARFAFGLAIASAVLAAAPAFAGPVALNLAGLDTSTPAGKAELARRIHRAADTYCRDQQVTGSRLASPECVSAVEQELKEKASIFLMIKVESEWNCFLF